MVLLYWEVIASSWTTGFCASFALIHVILDWDLVTHVVPGGYEPLVTFPLTFSRTQWVSQDEGHGEWKMRVGGGESQHGSSKPGMGRSSPQVLKECFAKKWQVVSGPTDNGELWGLTASSLALATAFFPVLFWKGIMRLLAPGNYHLWTFFSLCHVRKRHIQTLPVNSTFRNYRHKPI